MLKRDGVQSDFLGESRQYLQEQGRFAITFAFALAFIFLVLAAQFESIRDPLLILTTVPWQPLARYPPCSLVSAR